MVFQESPKFQVIQNHPHKAKSCACLPPNSLTSSQRCRSALSGEHPPSLEKLVLDSCSTLASLPNEPQAYVSLQRLEIKDCPAISCSTLASLPDKLQSLRLLVIKGCPAIKKLPRCLQQQLGSIENKYLDAQYEVMTFKPKTWKEIPRLVRERKEHKRMAEERKLDDRTI